MTAGRNVNSKSKTWGTPKKIVDAVRELFGVIWLDPCSNDFSIVTAKVEYKLPVDGLKESWDFPNVYVNCPYGKDYERKTSISDWLEKGCNLPKEISRIFLIPVAVNTSHWKKFIWGKAQCICFLSDTRLKFLEEGIENKTGCPMACCIVYYGENKYKFKNVFSKLGAVVEI